jgi:dihydrofolate reductase
MRERIVEIALISGAGRQYQEHERTGGEFMRKVVLYELLSLDGVAERPDEFVLDFDPVMQENLGRVVSSQDVVLLGRRTFDDWAEYWPTGDNELFASFINGVRKYVVTSSAPPVWTNASVVEGALNEFVEELRKMPGGDIGVHGSIAVAQHLLRASLIDQLRLVISPALAGSGRKLFDNPAPHRLELTRSVTSPTGYLLVDFDIRH